MVYDALDMTYRQVAIRKDPAATPITGLIDYEAFCGTISDEAAQAVVDSTIDVRTLASWLEQRERGERDFVLVDVREHGEYEINRIPGSVLVPKDRFLLGDAVGQLPHDRQVVFHCKAGARSAEVLALAKAAGFADAVHVAGGTSAWVSQIDPDQPSY
jgi:adenylyltransferase/sulfurtransferase